MTTEPAVPYHAAVPGTPVMSRTGTEIGTLEHVLEMPGDGGFDGLVVATDWGLRFIDAGEVDLITVRHVRCRLDDERAARVARPVRYATGMSTDSGPSGAPDARPASLVPSKPTLEGLEEKWSRRWEESGVVQV